MHQMPEVHIKHTRLYLLIIGILKRHTISVLWQDLANLRRYLVITTDNEIFSWASPLSEGRPQI